MGRMATDPPVPIASPFPSLDSADVLVGSWRGHMRPLQVQSVFASTLPIMAEEIHKVLAALGPDLAAIFDEDI